MGIPPVYPCPYCGYNFMLCAHGPNHAAELSEGISRLSLEAIGQQGSMGKMGLNPGAKEFVPRFVTPPVHVPPPPSREQYQKLLEEEKQALLEFLQREWGMPL